MKVLLHVSIRGQQFYRRDSLQESMYAINALFKLTPKRNRFFYRLHV